MLARRPVVAGKAGVLIDGGRTLRPGRQKKFFQVELGFWRYAAHLMLAERCANFLHTAAWMALPRIASVLLRAAADGSIVVLFGVKQRFEQGR